MYRYLLIFLILVSGPAFSACVLSLGIGETCGSATRYDVEVQSVSLCTESTCASPVSIGSTSKTFDIASAAVGSAIGSYANFDAVTPGTYTHVSTVVSRTMVLSGAAVTGCTGSLTSSERSVPNNLGGGSQTVLDAAMSSLGITWSGTNLKIITALSSPITISKTSVMPSISVKFGTAKGIMCIATLYYPGVPDVSVTVQ